MMRNNKMNKNFKKILLILIALLFTLSLVGCSDESIKTEDISQSIIIDEYYYSYEDVLAYLIEYDTLPINYINKKDARELGWDSSKGNLWDIEEGLVIGGDKFSNREGILPKKDTRQYYECDVNYNGGYRGADRLVYSNDGLIYYTQDHYKTFELVYGDE